MSEILPVKQRVNAVGRHLLSDNFLRQLRYALPRAGVTAERMARIVLTEVRRVPKLAECSTESLLGAVMQCAQLGLEPGGAMGLAYLIPRKGEVTFQLGYKGLLALLWRSEKISSVQAEVVRERDDFDYANGIPPRLFHKPARGSDEARGPVTHVYAVIGTSAGGWIHRVMTVEQVEEIRKKHSEADRSGRSSPWQTHWDEMACKTVLKRVCKRAPISAEIQQAIDLDDRAELGIEQDLEIDVTPPSADPAEASPSATADQPNAEAGSAPSPAERAS